jgi:hypothetical protein
MDQRPTLTLQARSSYVVRTRPSIIGPSLVGETIKQIRCWETTASRRDVFPRNDEISRMALFPLVPAEAGTQLLDSRLRGNERLTR